MENRKTYTFPTDVFDKLQEFLDDLILEEMNAENPNDEEIDALNNMQYYLSESYTENPDDNSIEIELELEDYEFLFNRLLIPAIYSYDMTRLYKRLDNLFDRLKKLYDRAISDYDRLEDISNRQNALIDEQSAFIDLLMNETVKVESD